MAQEFHDEPKSSRTNAADNLCQVEKVIAQDRKPPGTRTKQSGPAVASAEQFSEIVSK
jgi:hypothetical protein